MPNILDKRFVYVPSHKTSVAKTFAKRRKELAEQKARDEAVQIEQTVKVRRLGK